jgi:hypothetical protein
MGHWIVDTAGIGAAIAIGVGLSVFAAYVGVLRWIQTAPASASAPAQGISQDAEPDVQHASSAEAVVGPGGGAVTGDDIT